MTKDLTRLPSSKAIELLQKAQQLASLDTQELNQKRNIYIDANFAYNTKRTYKPAWLQFCAYCHVTQAEALPASPLSVGNYLIALAETCKPATLEVHLSAIKAAHDLFGHTPSPTKDKSIQTLLNGIKKKNGVAPKSAIPIKRELLENTIEDYERSFPDEVKTLRWKLHKAILLTCFWGCFRRSELVAIQYPHLLFEDRWMSIFLPKSKTDQYQKGKKKEIPMRSDKFHLCANIALQNWLDAAGIEEGHIFRKVNRYGTILYKEPLGADGSAVTYVVQKYFGKLYSAHSLRGGFACSAAEAGVDLLKIKNAGNWDDINTVLRYLQGIDLRINNAADEMFGRMA